jgi:hypothetical protein
MGHERPDWPMAASPQRPDILGESCGDRLGPKGDVPPLARMQMAEANFRSSRYTSPRRLTRTLEAWHIVPVPQWRVPHVWGFDFWRLGRDQSVSHAFIPRGGSRRRTRQAGGVLS